MSVEDKLPDYTMISEARFPLYVEALDHVWDGSKHREATAAIVFETHEQAAQWVSEKHSG